MKRIKLWYLIFIDNSLTLKDLEIIKIQNQLNSEGWQWSEDIFNDGHPYNCSIIFTKKKDPNYLSEHILGDCGWGRFSRITAWRRAYKTLKLK